ncbi:MAG: hypothetical protein Q8K75_09935 [Chlamydiales bacterium]|nr:hypothetical protein [Chlamydiales bacterium]
MRLTLISLYLLVLLAPTTTWSLTMREIAQSASNNIPPQAIAKEAQQRLQPWVGEETTLRGFLYKSIDGRWVLSDQPDLKTCCVGTSNHILKQVTLLGTFDAPSPSSVVVVKGIFSIEPNYNDKGELTSLLYLKESKLVDEPSQATSFPLSFIVGSLLAMGLFVVSAKMMRR